jgi:hypothetical protein
MATVEEEELVVYHSDCCNFSFHWGQTGEVLFA